MMAGRELRLALVLNGGVSLAVWMAGVIHEIDLLRRASPATGSDVAESEWDRALGSLGRAERPVDRVVVDLVFGCS